MRKRTYDVRWRDARGNARVERRKTLAGAKRLALKVQRQKGTKHVWVNTYEFRQFRWQQISSKRP